MFCYQEKCLSEIRQLYLIACWSFARQLPPLPPLWSPPCSGTITFSYLVLVTRVPHLMCALRSESPVLYMPLRTYIESSGGVYCRCLFENSELHVSSLSCARTYVVGVYMCGRGAGVVCTCVSGSYTPPFSACSFSSWIFSSALFCLVALQLLQLLQLFSAFFRFVSMCQEVSISRHTPPLACCNVVR